MRTEVQFRSSGFAIDFDVLNNPSNYFFGDIRALAYSIRTPCPNALKLLSVSSLLLLSKRLKLLKDSLDAIIHFFRSVFADDKATHDILTDIKG